MNKLRKKLTISDLIIIVLLIVGALVSIFPVLWMLISSIKPISEILKAPPTIIPESLSLESYRFSINIGFFRFFLNSIFISIIKTAISLYLCTLIGYTLAKIRFKGSNIVFITILITMMVPFPVLVLPLYEMVASLGLLNNYLSVIIPGSIAPFGIFLIRQFAIGMSDEILESAEIDGANQFAIFHKIAIPNLKPAISALGIFLFLFSWNQLIWPYLVLNKQSMYTLPLGLTIFTNEHFNNYGPMIASASISILPVVIVYIFAQRNFIEGITFTGLKE